MKGIRFSPLPPLFQHSHARAHWNKGVRSVWNNPCRIKRTAKHQQNTDKYGAKGALKDDKAKAAKDEKARPSACLIMTRQS